MSTTSTRKVIEWPAEGSAKHYPMGGWYVVDHDERPGHGYTPIAGPFRCRAEAIDAVELAGQILASPADDLIAYVRADHDRQVCAHALLGHAVPWQTCPCPTARRATRAATLLNAVTS